VNFFSNYHARQNAAGPGFQVRTGRVIQWVVIIRAEKYSLNTSYGTNEISPLHQLPFAVNFVSVLIIYMKDFSSAICRELKVFLPSQRYKLQHNSTT
jgi:hypothetical protein